jgi:hypothetical protein
MSPLSSSLSTQPPGTVRTGQKLLVDDAVEMRVFWSLRMRLFLLLTHWLSDVRQIAAKKHFE